MRRFFVLVAFVAALNVSQSRAVAGPIVIDNFKTTLAGGSTIGGGILSSNPFVDRNSGAQTGAGILGTRGAMIEAGSFDYSTGLQISGVGIATIGSHPFNTGNTVHLIYYDFVTDLSSYSSIAFNISGFSTGANPASPTFSVKYTDSTAGVVTIASSQVINGDGSITVDFGSNLRSSVTGFDIAFRVREGDVFTIGGNDGITIVESTPTAVPEPSSIGRNRCRDRVLLC